MYSHQSYINEVCAALYQAWKKLKLENFEHRDDSFDWWINSNKITLSNLHRSRHDGENCRRLNKGLSALKFGDDIMTLMREWSRIGWINFRQRGKSGSFIAKSALLFMTINLRLWGERQRVTVFLPPKRNKSGRFEGRMPSPYLISCRYNVWKNADHSGWSQLARHGREGTDITRIKPLLAQHDLLPSRGHSGWSDGRGRWRRQSNQSNSNLSSLLLPFEYRWGKREGDTHHTLRGPKASMAKGWINETAAAAATRPICLQLKTNATASANNDLFLTLLICEISLAGWAAQAAALHSTNCASQSAAS